MENLDILRGIQIWLHQITPPPQNWILIKDLKIGYVHYRIPPPLPFVLHHGGICVVDWCVETNTVFPKDTVSLVSTHVLCERLICDAKRIRKNVDKISQNMGYSVLDYRIPPFSENWNFPRRTSDLTNTEYSL